MCEGQKQETALSFCNRLRFTVLLPQVAERLTSGSEGRLPSLQRAGRAPRHSSYGYGRFHLLSHPLNTHCSSLLQFLTAITTKSMTDTSFITSSVSFTLPLCLSSRRGTRLWPRALRCITINIKNNKCCQWESMFFLSAVLLHSLCHSLVRFYLTPCTFTPAQNIQPHPLTLSPLCLNSILFFLSPFQS